jgi:ribose transport system substrate-binding protein
MLHRLWDEKLPLPKTTDTGMLMVTKDNVATYAEDAKNPKMFLDMEGKTLEQIQGSVTIQPTQAPAVTTKKKIFFMNQQVGNPFWNVVKQGVDDACAKYGFDCVMQGPTNMDNPAMISMIEAAIATGEYDGMLIPAIVPDMFTPVINEAVDKGIAVITFCTDAPQSKELAFVGTIGFGAGKTAGEFMVNLVNQKLGGKANINIMSGQAAQVDLNDRIAGFKSALPAGMTVTSIDYGEGGIKDTLSKLEARFVSDPSINAFFSSMGDGGSAIMSEYPSYKDRIDKSAVVMFDDLPATLDGVKQGVIAATAVQRQYNWGFGSVYMLHRLWDEKLPLPKITDTGMLMVTKDNVATYAEDAKNPKMFLDMEGKP